MAWCGARPRSKTRHPPARHRKSGLPDLRHFIGRTRASPSSATSFEISAGIASSRELHVFEITRLVVDADTRRRDPACEFAGLDDLAHQALDDDAVTSLNSPICRWNATCGSWNRKLTPTRSMILFQRSRPRWQSAV